MFISLRYKLFATLLAAVLVVVIGMFLLIHWSFARGFLSYVNTVELKRLDSLARNLETAYADQGDWAFLQDNPQLWRRFLAASTPEGPQQFDPLADVFLSREAGKRRRQPGMGNGMRHNLRPEMRQLFEARVVLLDEAKNVMIGPRDLPATMATIPLKQETMPIGFLGHIPQQQGLAHHQLQFVRQQKKSFAIISLIIAALATLIAFPLTSRLVRRINAVAAGTHSLAAGKYATRLAGGPADELGQLTRDFNSLALTLEKNERSRRQWVADISHELRTPLAVLRGEIEALQDGVRELTSDSLASLHAEIMRLNRLVDDFFQLAMSDIGALTYRKERVKPGEILNHAAELFRPEFSRKNIRLAVKMAAGDELHLFADPERLQQLFANLLSNSLKYTTAGGELQISCLAAGRSVEILFEDSHPGVAAPDIERMFERLFRVDNSRNRLSGGAGLGLAICRNIVEAHGGTITAAPSSLGGIRIKVSLPTGEQG